MRHVVRGSATARRAGARRPRRAPRGEPGRAVPPTTTPVARPLSTITRSTGAPVTTCPPSARSRVANASLSRPAPPSGTGKPTVCPSMASNRPISPDPADVEARSACAALPATSIRAPRPAEAAAGHRYVEGVLSRGEEPVHEVEATDARQLQRSPQPVAHGWHGGEQGGDQGRSDPAPLVDEGQPGGPVTRLLTVQQVGRHRGIAMQHRPRAVGPGMARAPRVRGTSATRTPPGRVR